MLLCGDGVCGSWDPGPLLKDVVAVFHAADIQLSGFVSATVWAGAVSEVSGTQAREITLVLQLFFD